MNIIHFYFVFFVGAQEFDYETSPMWYTRWPSCGGLQQSPIDLPKLISPKHGGKLDFRYSTENLIVKEENNRIIIASAQSMGELDFTRDGIDFTFKATEIEIHNLSEHRIGGHQFKFEIIISHEVNVFSEPERLLLSFFLDDAGNISEEFKDLPKLLETKKCNNCFNLQNVVREAGEVFYQYRGSLSHPPCDEGIQRIVMKQALAVDPETISNLQSFFTKKNNREIQDPRNIFIKLCRKDSCINNEKTYSYFQQELWPETCAGNRQSPIHLKSSTMNSTVPSHFSVNYQKVHEFSVDYFRDTIEVKGNFGDLIFPPKSGFKYTVRKIRFKFPSEHVMNDIRYSGEMEIFHEGFDSWLVTSYLLDKDESGETDTFFDSFTTELPEKDTAIKIEKILDIETLTEDVRRGNEGLRGVFSHYKGSFSFPPCLEKIDWVIFHEPLKVSQRHVFAFLRALRPEDREPRKLQDKGYRTALRICHESKNGWDCDASKGNVARTLLIACFLPLMLVIHGLLFCAARRTSSVVPSETDSPTELLRKYRESTANLENIESLAGGVV